MSNPHVLLETSEGDILLELYPDKAPVTVENFLQYVDDGHYNETIFHRVIRNFMIQGGGFDPDMNQKSTRDTIINEADNGLKNDKGTIAMARTFEPHSASSQFFINAQDNPGLNFRSKDEEGWGYCVFGKVIEGEDIVKKINWKVTTNRAGHADVPKENIEIVTARRFE
ncbi:MAG: peptidylprolyl isomerase [Desulfovibrio sp.]|nr:MAG: peptidylprolyl isomerase [Desulfovibrio sp.]